MRTEAQKNADKRYRQKKLNDGTKKQINATLNIEDYAMIDDYCKSTGISKVQLIVAACREYIEKISQDCNDIPAPDEIEALKETQSETKFISHDSIDWD